NKAGSGYTLTAATTGPAGMTSTPFDVSPGAATHLAFTVPPSTTPANATITPPIQVTALDVGNNVATAFAGNVVMAIPASSNPSGGTLGGTKTVAAVAGVATFGDLSVDKAGTGYTLTAAATGLTTPTSAVFNVSAGGATHLVFAVQPSTTTAGAAVAPAVQVAAQDAQGNTATPFTGSIGLAIVSNPGGGTLAGTTSVAAVSGVATFANVSIDKVGTGYTLAASATGPAGATSTAFNITPGAASHLIFSVQPTTATAGSVITPAVQVAAQDAQGNTAAGLTGDVSVGIGTNPGGGALSGTTTVAAVNGVATFSTLSINRTGTGYTLTASGTGLATGGSAAFNVSAGSASALVFTGEPTNAVAGATITP